MPSAVVIVGVQRHLFVLRQELGKNPKYIFMTGDDV
jgi:hypothetical protein